MSILHPAWRRQQTGRRAALERQLADQSAELTRLFGRQPTADQPALGSEQQPAARDLANTSVHDAACRTELGAQSVGREAGLPSESAEHLASTCGLQQLQSQLPTLHSHQAAQLCGQQRDEVAAAAQQIAYHAGAASLARQGAITLQEQVRCI